MVVQVGFQGIMHVEKEQVRKRGLPPLLLGLDERGQAPLPDLFSFKGLHLVGFAACAILSGF